MTKVEICEILKISRPTLDKRLKEDSEMYLFLMSFTRFEYLDRIKRVKGSLNG